MKYIDNRIVFDDVKNKLPKFFDGNHPYIDESILVPRLKECLAKLRLNNHPEGKTIIEIKNSEGDLPEDFYQLCLAFACIAEYAEPYSRYEETIQTQEESIVLCDSVCNPCVDKCGNYMIVQTFKRMPKQLVWNKFELVKATSETFPVCTNDCINTKSNNPYEIDIRNGKIHTNFETGLIHMSYIKKLETVDSYLIPDNAKIIEWIKHELMLEVFNIAYYNGEPDIANRRRDLLQETAIKYQNALNIIKTPEIKELYDIRNHFVTRYNNLRAWDTYYSNGYFNTTYHNR